MPIKKGYSKKTRNQNIAEIMSSFNKTGKIGTSEPRSPQSAAKQAAAIAYEAQRKALSRISDSKRRTRLKALKK